VTISGLSCSYRPLPSNQDHQIIISSVIKLLLLFLRK